jgi:glycosyltransferase involved in cell wall biosynthesis
MQDIVSDMAARILPRTYPLIGHLAAAYLRRKEFAIALDSAHVIAIAPAFAERCRQKGVPDSKLTMIPNWASLDDIAILPKHNDWRLTHNPLNRPMMLYAGTLGLKHDPSLLSDLAQTNPNALMIVVSEGMGRQWLEATKRSQNLDNLILMDYQPQSQVAAMVTAADLTIALLEPEAGGMSVPSKVLTYLAAGRPILSAIPPSNLAAKTIETAGAGHNFSPSNRAGFLAASRQMLNDPNNLDELGLSARRYAEQTFHMDQIGTRFLSVFQSCL